MTFHFNDSMRHKIEDIVWEAFHDGSNGLIICGAVDSVVEEIGKYGIAAVARIKDLEMEVEHLNQFCIDSLSENIRLEDLLLKATTAMETIVVDDTWGLGHSSYMLVRHALATIKKENQ